MLPSVPSLSHLMAPPKAISFPPFTIYCVLTESYTQEGIRFTCVECERDFSTKSNLVAHQRQTLGHIARLNEDEASSTWQQCENCKREFSKKSNLTRHKRNCIGLDKLDFVCDSCQKAFHSKKALDCHLRQVHKASVETTPEVAESGSFTTAPQRFAHSVCVFVSCRGDETVSAKDSDFGASQVERNCFGGVLLALCTFHGTGDARAITVVHPNSITASEFAQAATEMGCFDVWRILMDSGCVFTFSDSIELRLAFESAARRATVYGSSLSQTKQSLMSVFIVGHGDFERLKVGFGARFGSDGKTLKRGSMIRAAEVSDLIDVSGADMVHIMTCKASKFVRTLLDKTKCIPRRHEKVLFFAYGDEDITTVPLVFAAGTRNLLLSYRSP